jgi:Tfp pilus assembly protein PilF
MSCKVLAALVFSRRHDVPRAVALWKQSLALDPDQADVRNFLARFDHPGGLR